jgi:hypothetical protein
MAILLQALRDPVVALRVHDTFVTACLAGYVRPVAGKLRAELSPEEFALSAQAEVPLTQRSRAWARLLAV